MSIKTYKDLNVFSGAYKLALDISRETKRFPSHEQYELARQLRRAARSIPVNVVEGWAKRASAVEFKRYLQISSGSCEECKLWFEMSRDEGYLSSEKYEKLANRFNLLSAMLRSLWKNWQSFRK